MQQRTPDRSRTGTAVSLSDPASGAATVLLTGDLFAPVRLTVADLRALPQHPARVSFTCSTSGERRHSFTGPLLHDVAVHAVPGAVPALRKERAGVLVTVTGVDGHQAVLSWAEIDPEYTRGRVLLAVCADGAALERTGPQLVVPHDRCGGRYVSTVMRIWIGAHRPGPVPGGVEV
jgi:hypothetical protein